MQKPATHRKSNFTVLSFFYGHLAEVIMKRFFQNQKTLTLSFSPNFKFKICQNCLDLNK
jgi:hypothetical protein